MIGRIVFFMLAGASLSGWLRGALASEPPQTALRRATDPALLAMVESEWRREDRLDASTAPVAPSIVRHLDQTQRLLDDLRADRPDGVLAVEAIELERLRKAAPDEKTYLEVRWLKRHIALANPLARFGKLLFVKRSPPSYSHLVMQYFGWRQRPGGGIFVLEKPGESLAVRDILGGKLAQGSVLEPSLSFDGQRVVFSYVDLNVAIPPALRPEGEDVLYFHLYAVGADGEGMRQLTSGPYDDMMPVWLPDGGIAFSSSRRKGYARCFGGQFGTRWHVYTLHRVEADGTGLRALSFHDTNEWFPSVMPDGQLLYSRWDYIDRDAVTHQNLWLTRPDGTNPVALWGNASPNPHCSFQAKAVPGSQKILLVASAHHSITGGSLVLLDPNIHPNSHVALRRLTPEVKFPESEGRGIGEWYDSPWPLSEKYYLVSYSPFPLVFEPGPNPKHALGIYLFDAFGNRELLFRDPEIGSCNPIPLRPRPRPPAIAPQVKLDCATGQMLVQDIYRGLGNVSRGTIKELRIVQIFPKTTPLANNPMIGCAGEENPRAILGTVPVEADGSAYFEVPAGKPILFQALTADGSAYQTMRSLTYVQPGEQISCIGCHEDRMTSTPSTRSMAVLRAPSKITPGEMGGAPFSYTRFVQPILDKQCLSCHGKDRGKIAGKMDFANAASSYQALTRNSQLVPRYEQRNQVQITPPGGARGALGSKLLQMLRAGHKDVKLSDAELRRLAAWIDMNAVFLGSCDPKDNERERLGEPIAMPKIQ